MTNFEKINGEQIQLNPILKESNLLENPIWGNPIIENLF
jgi:hypothetical protein